MTSAHDPPGVPARPTSVRDKCWQRQLVAERGLLPQPWFAAVTGDRVGSADLGDVLLARPRVVHPEAAVRLQRRRRRPRRQRRRPPHGGERLPGHGPLPGRVPRRPAAARAGRGRGRGHPPAAVREPRHRRPAGVGDGAVDPGGRDPPGPGRRVDLRAPGRGAADRAATGSPRLGAVCKRIDTPIGAVVARDFRELPLEESLTRFLAPRVPPADLGDSVRRARDLVLSAGDRRGRGRRPARGGARGAGPPVRDRRPAVLEPGDEPAPSSGSSSSSSASAGSTARRRRGTDRRPNFASGSAPRSASCSLPHGGTRLEVLVAVSPPRG